MTVRVSDLTFKFTITNFSELKVNDIYSPVFSSSNNMLWQLKVQKKAKEDYDILIVPIAGPDECNWNKRSELSINIFANVKRSGREYTLHDSNVMNIDPDSPICEEFGVKAFTGSLLKSEELIVGVKIKSFEYESKECKHDMTLNPIPKSLTNAWRNHMREYYNVDDVEFDVEGKKYLVCGSILKERSEYFRSLLSGQWSEATKIPKNEGKGGEREMRSDNESQIEGTIRYHIEISDCNARTFGEMLSYLYTNEIDWFDGDKTITIGLFCLADKYLLSDLRQRAKDKVIDELDTTNVANIMFSLVPKYDDLKRPVLNFMANNFKKVIQTQGFKDVLANPENYLGFGGIFSEVLEEYFKF